MKTPTQLDRTIVHEAGHALAAWYSSSVREVKNVFLHANGGATLYAATTRTAAGLWDAVTIGLAGMAAEVAEFGVVSSGNCKADITKSREIAENIVAGHGLKSRPWPVEETSVLDFARMFRTPVSGETVAVMADGYRRARWYISEFHAPFERVVAALRSKQALTADDIASLFGPRIWGP